MAEPQPDRPRPTNPPSKLDELLHSVPGPIQVFAYFMSAVSVLNLLSDVLQLQSDIFLWVNSYRRLVERVGEFLFGWIDLWWFEVTALELHILVIFGIAIRAFSSMNSSRPVSIGSYVSGYWPFVFYALLLPVWLFVIIAVVYFGSLWPFASAVYRRSSQGDLSNEEELTFTAWDWLSTFVVTVLGFVPQVLFVSAAAIPYFVSKILAGRFPSLERARRPMSEPLMASLSGCSGPAVVFGNPRTYVRRLGTTVLVVVALVIADQLWLQALQ